MWCASSSAGGVPPAPEGTGGGWLLILVIRNGMIHGIVNLWLLNDFDHLGNDFVGWWFVGSGVLAGASTAVQIDLLGIERGAPSLWRYSQQ